MSTRLSRKNLCAKPTADLACDTAGRLRPRYAVAQLLVKHLARGDVVLEPHLGDVRVTAIFDLGYDEIRHVALRQVYWVQDDGLSLAARQYPADALVTVRRPALRDWALIQLRIDQAHYWSRDLDSPTARLIAAHLHRGPGSALYAFAVTGAISDRLYDELDEIRYCTPPAVHRWVHALARYCLGRDDVAAEAAWDHPTRSDTTCHYPRGA
jgi:hypothetical protein